MSIYPAFATHNAYTIGAIKAMAGDTPVRIPAPARHGRGSLRRARASWKATGKTPVRIYAPVGGHKELLAYLVRRLLENGANCSASSTAWPMPMCRWTSWSTDPVGELAALEP